MKKAKIIPYIIILSIFTFLVWNVLKDLNQIREIDLNFNLKILILPFFTAFLIHLVNVYSWHLLTKAMGMKIKLSENVKIWMFSNLGRYIPGKIWQYLGRVMMLSKHGIKRNQGTLAVVIEAMLNLSIGSLVVLLVVSLFNLSWLNGFKWILLSAIFLPLIISFIFSNQKLLGILISFLQKITKRANSLKVFRISFPWLNILAFVFFLQYLFAGITLFLIAQGFTYLPLELLPIFIGIYAAAWLLGYISFFAPGGLGVQEISIAGLLSFFIPLSLASLIAISFRIMIALSELLILSIIFLKLRKKT